MNKWALAAEREEKCVHSETQTPVGKVGINNYTALGQVEGKISTGDNADSLQFTICTENGSRGCFSVLVSKDADRPAFARCPYFST